MLRPSAGRVPSFPFRLFPLSSSLLLPQSHHFHQTHHVRGLLTTHSQSSPLLKISPEIRAALLATQPVVALETTIYTHGFPYPENVALAAELESVVRANGGVPATIGVVAGEARVGLEVEEIIDLCQAGKGERGKERAVKVSRRDLGWILGMGITGRKFHGGTTISGTMLLAHLAGIKVFATGGLGGVHRDGENSLDISADLTELGRTPVAVVSAGCKSFLDLPRTLEFLETQGVGVATFADGRSGQVNVPAFYVRDSGVKSPRTIRDEKDAAAIFFAQSRLPVNSGLWFAGPVPEKDSLSKEEVDEWVRIALEEASRKGIHGAANTPYILERIKQLSGGRSVVANRAGIRANVERGTKVAVELARLEREQGLPEKETSMLKVSNSSPTKQSSASLIDDPPVEYDVLVAGALAADLNCDFVPLEGFAGQKAPSLHTSNPATISQTFGGVGHNCALASHYLGARTVLCSAVGDDQSGKALLDHVKSIGLPVPGIKVIEDANARTAQYAAVNDQNRNLFVAMADMSIQSSPILDSFDFWKDEMLRYKPKWVVVDANWSPSILSHIMKAAKAANSRIVFEPVSAQKATRISGLIKSSAVFPDHTVDIIAPNVVELENMFQAARNSSLFESAAWWQVIDGLNLPSSGSTDRLVRATNAGLVSRGIPQQSLQLLPYFPCILTKLGAQGCLLSQLIPPNDERLQQREYLPNILGRAVGDDSVAGGVYMRLFPPAEVLQPEDVVSVTGAGDTLLGVLVARLSRQFGVGRVEDVVMEAQKAAVLSLKSREAVSPALQGYKRASSG